MSVHPVRAGLKLSPQGNPLETLRAVWHLADEAGFDHVWGFDHFGPALPYDAGDDVFEGWAILAAMAEHTRRARIGLMATGNTYRHPAVLAKMATTVDHFSGGRLEFGIGAAWVEKEHQMLGLRLGGAGERIDRMRESLTVMKSLWTQPLTTFEGRHYTLHEAVSDPKPVQRPHPPIWIGGTGERKTLRVAAELADVWNAFSVDAVEAGRLSAVLDAHCAEVGRDPAAVRRSIQMPMDAEDPDATVALARAYFEVGFTEFVLTLRPGDPVAAATIAAERVLPALHAWGA